MEIKKTMFKPDFPRNIQSLFSNLEMKIGGRRIQNITQYNYIFNILNGYVCGLDANNKNELEKMQIHLIKACG